MSVAVEALAQQARGLSHFEQFELACDVWDNWSNAAANHKASPEVLDLLSQRAAQRNAASGSNQALSFDAMVSKLGVRL
jgi:hypothetical protein